MAIWLVIGVPLLVFVIGVIEELTGRNAAYERRVRQRWAIDDPEVHVWTDVEVAAVREEKYARERRRQKALREQMNQTLN